MVLVLLLIVTTVIICSAFGLKGTSTFVIFTTVISIPKIVYQLGPQQKSESTFKEFNWKFFKEGTISIESN